MLRSNLDKTGSKSMYSSQNNTSKKFNARVHVSGIKTTIKQGGNVQSGTVHQCINKQ
jgi:hypothetical protein